MVNSLSIRDLHILAIVSIGESIVDTGIDVITNHLHSTVAHHEIAAGGMQTSEVAFAPHFAGAPIGGLGIRMIFIS